METLTAKYLQMKKVALDANILEVALQENLPMTLIRFLKLLASLQKKNQCGT